MLVLSKAWDLLRTIGLHGNGPGQFSDVDCIAVGGDGKVFISDHDRPGIQVFDRHGLCVKRIDIGEELGSAVAVDANGCVFISCYPDS